MTSQTKLNTTVSNCYVIITCYVQNVHRWRWPTHNCREVFHCSVINWISAEDQISCNASFNSEIVFWLWLQLMSDSIISPKRDNPVDWDLRSSELGGHLSLVMKSLQFDFSQSYVTPVEWLLPCTSAGAPSLLLEDETIR